MAEGDGKDEQALASIAVFCAVFVFDWCVALNNSSLVPLPFTGLLVLCKWLGPSMAVASAAGIAAVMFAVQRYAVYRVYCIYRDAIVNGLCEEHEPNTPSLPVCIKPTFAERLREHSGFLLWTVAWLLMVDFHTLFLLNGVSGVSIGYLLLWVVAFVVFDYCTMRDKWLLDGKNGDRVGSKVFANVLLLAASVLFFGWLFCIIMLFWHGLDGLLGLF